MKIIVTREHWDRGVNTAYPIMKRRLELRAKGQTSKMYETSAGYCEECVLAQAFKDAGFKEVMVNQNMAHLDGGRYYLPGPAQKLLRKFDTYETQLRTGRPQEACHELPAFPVEFEIDVAKE